MRYVCIPIVNMVTDYKMRVLHNPVNTHWTTWMCVQWKYHKCTWISRYDGFVVEVRLKSFQSGELSKTKRELLSIPDYSIMTSRTLTPSVVHVAIKMTIYNHKASNTKIWLSCFTLGRGRGRGSGKAHRQLIEIYCPSQQSCKWTPRRAHKTTHPLLSRHHC